MPKSSSTFFQVCTSPIKYAMSILKRRIIALTSKSSCVTPSYVVWQRKKISKGKSICFQKSQHSKKHAKLILQSLFLNLHVNNASDLPNSEIDPFNMFESKVCEGRKLMEESTKILGSSIVGNTESIFDLALQVKNNLSDIKQIT